MCWKRSPRSDRLAEVRRARTAGQARRALGAALLVAASLSAALATPAAAQNVIGDDGSGYERVGITESNDGVALRVYENPIELTSGPGTPVQDMPESPCVPDRMVTVEASTREVASAAFFAVRDGDATVLGQMQGIPEGAPVAVVLAFLPEGAQSAKMRLEAGGTDAADALADDLVVLAAQVDDVGNENLAYGASLGTVTFLDGDGKPVEKSRIFAGQDHASPECGGPAPLVLPDATGPPPEDEVAARKAIVDAYTTVFDNEEEGEFTDDDRLRALEAGEGLRNSLNAAGQFEGVGASTVEVGKVRFLDDHEAALFFEVSLDGAPFGKRLGRALLVDGEWKVATDTYCALLSLGNIPCP